ncbi:hypothetical protein BRYFOR_06092 [Marvinbryantia formatexigens DSM 14469]|uniref:Uncharacterized protein n=1 Tax=Marvinbryantia formatexigens DSM 14469 TaxID=478749 RepID=C6LBU7_9FIRM|nr:hypothetical protein BRYFOR_06092 [Marvinbryantia formatexigens DSM 14469]
MPGSSDYNAGGKIPPTKMPAASAAGKKEISVRHMQSVFCVSFV